MKTWQNLWNEYLAGRLSPSDIEAFLKNASGHEPEMREAIREMLEQGSVRGLGTEEQRTRLLREIQRKKEEPKEIPVIPRFPFIRRWGWVAASVALLVISGSYLWFRHSYPPTLASGHNELTADIEPGKKGAVLTLANGTQLVLDTLDNGVIATQKGARLVLENGQLAYNPDGETGADEVYNTMSTPKGRQFNLVLPDGTRVWLNAASSIRYPTRFSGSERKVTITGEAYFDVQPQATQPFKVQINGQAVIEVLGTSFNVNAYENESNINTTLLAGSIKLVINDPGRSEAILRPGQQAQIENTQRGTQAVTNGKLSRKIRIIDHADTDKVLAWKNGAFNFQDVSLQEVMRQLERWYDIEVMYEAGVPDIQFIGKMSRDIKLSELLKLLKDSEVDFRLEEGRKLIIRP